jgi:hypothetical protein
MSVQYPLYIGRSRAVRISMQNSKIQAFRIRQIIDGGASQIVPWLKMINRAAGRKERCLVDRWNGL